MAALLILAAVLPAPLIDRLALPRFRDRAAAHRALASLGRLALPALERAARSHPSAEARARCAVLLRSFAWEIADRDSRGLLPEGDAPVFSWAALEDEHERWLREAWEGRQEGRERDQDGHHEDPVGAALFDPTAHREAVRLWIRAQLLQRRPPGEIRAEIERLRREAAK